MQLVAVVKRECETCELISPVLENIAQHLPLKVYSQDDPGFPETISGVIDDRELAESHRLNIEIVPTLICIDDGVETDRTFGWHQGDWQRLTGIADLGSTLPESRPGCGSKTTDPGMPEKLALKFGTLQLKARAIEVHDEVDPMEIAYERGWSDGLPVTLPTDLRVARMLAATDLDPNHIVGDIPPDLAPCTVEKVAINAVMAGCKPEYFSVVLAVVRAALRPEFSMHGLLATLWFSGPVVIVNGPISRRIGMNSQGNALGQGNRANATIGRALQLLIRNVGGGIPGGVDRSILGNPGKYTFCFAEDESDDEWTPLNVARGAKPGDSSVTLFHGDGVQAVKAWHARSADELCHSIAASLCAVCHPKVVGWSGAILVLGPEHYDMFSNEGWQRTEIEAGLREALRRPGTDLVRGAHGIAEGIDPALADQMHDKFHEGYLLVVRAGGRGGAMSAIIGGWSAHRRPKDVQIVTEEITP